jgi:histidyl-tRNA synthetase
LKKGMKAAAKLGADCVYIVGVDVVTPGMVAVKDMHTGKQESIPLHP